MSSECCELKWEGLGMIPRAVMVWQNPEGLAGQRVEGKGQSTGMANVQGQVCHHLTGCRGHSRDNPV